MRILVVSGYTTEQELKDAEVPYETAINDQLALSRLLKRPYDTFYSVRENIEYLAKEKSLSEPLKIFDISKIPYPLCIGKQWSNSAELLRKFDQGLEIIKSDGTYQSIQDKYR